MASFRQVVGRVVDTIKQDPEAKILVVVRCEEDSDGITEELNGYVSRGLIKGFSRNVQFVWLPESGVSVT